MVVQQTTKIRDRYKKVLLLTRDTVWESDKTHKETSLTRERRGQPLSGDHKAVLWVLK